MSKPILIQEVESKAQKTYVDGQDASLTQQINVLNSDKLNKFITIQSGTSIKSLYETGIYKSNGWADYPTECNDGQGTLIIINYLGDNNVGWVQYMFVTPHSNERYIASLTNKTWSGWSKLATTTKTEILPTAGTGITILSNYTCVVNNMLYVSLRAKKTDDSAFTAGALMATLPTGYRPKTDTALSISCHTEAGGGISNVTASVYCSSAGNIWSLIPTNSTVKMVAITGVIVL